MALDCLVESWQYCIDDAFTVGRERPLQYERPLFFCKESERSSVQISNFKAARGTLELFNPVFKLSFICV